MVCKPIHFSADSTIVCLIVNAFICFVCMSICSIYWCLLNDFCMFSIIWHIIYICPFAPFIGVCSMISVCSQLFGTLFILCPCVLLVYMSLLLFTYVSSLLLFIALFGTEYGESVSYCLCWQPVGGRHTVFEMAYMCVQNFETGCA